MIEKLLFSPSASMMEKGLDTAALRNRVIANNLANVDTPGFKRSEVLFESELQKALSHQNNFKLVTTNEKHMQIGGTNAGSVTPRVIVNKTTSMRNDGNNVDIDREMSALATNSIMYSALAQGLSGEFQKMKMVIEGR